MLIRRHVALAFVSALIGFAVLPDAARAGGSGLFGAGFPPWASPAEPLFCLQRWQCGRYGCSWQRICAPQTFASSYLWQVQDNWPPQALARYDDAWCRVYGPPGSWANRQCHVNNYYTRLSVPIRQTK
jgi:hypothetical protein